MSGEVWRERWVRFCPAGFSAVLTLLIVGPLSGSGYLLLRDAVSTPRSYLTDSALGLGDAAPRAVPQDALLAVLSPLVDGGLLVKAILITALWAAGYGAAVLVRVLLRVSLGPQLVASTVALWNPYAAERLLQGHWSLLAGYAALPWAALAAYRIRAAASGLRLAHRAPALSGWAALAGCFAAAGLTPTGALLAGCTALVLVGRRNLLVALGLLAVASAPWLLASVLSGGGAEPSDPAGVAAFAARAEPGLGTLGSLAGLGGIWNGDAVPDSRTTLLALAGTVLLLAIVATGIRAVATRDRESDAIDAGSDNLRVRRALLVLASAAILLPALGALPWGISVGEWLVTRIPGAGLLRDTQKYVALAMPAYALCAAAGCRVLARRWSGTAGGADVNRTAPTYPQHHSTTASPGAPERLTTAPDQGTGRPSNPVAMAVAATAFIVLLMLPLFDLAWGVGGALRPVHYPAGWRAVAERIDAPGDVAVLPGGMFRKFGYSGAAPVLDPAPRMLPNDVLQTGVLPVHGRSVSGEGARAKEVETLLLQGGSADDLAALGVGWVLVEHTTPGPLGESKATLAQLTPVFTDADLTLYRVAGTEIRQTDHAHRLLAAAAHLLWAAVLLGSLLLAAITAHPRHPGQSRHPGGGRDPAAEVV